MVETRSDYRVCVLDMQPIEPPVGGGRLRLMGLYHALGSQMRTIYVGTYDWPGEKYREHQLSDTLTEINIPLSNKHFSVADCIKGQVHGKTVIDVTFHRLAYLSPEYVRRVREEVREADIIFFSHPWIYPIVRQELERHRQLVVYDSHNVEGLLRYTLLSDSEKGREIAKEVVRIEYELCHFADRILACSHDDRLLFHKIYSVPLERIAVVPNGAFTNTVKQATSETKQKLKRDLGLSGRPLAIFLASAYPPNVEAGEFILNHLAPQQPEIDFVICGGVGDFLDKSQFTGTEISNLVITGFLEEQEKMNFIAAADVAINPMFSGSGTNIKMFDFLAAGLPVVSTPTGARGIDQSAYHPAFIVCQAQDFPQTLKKVIDDQHERATLARNARRLVEECYSWERLSSELGLWARRQLQVQTKERIYFTVVVASYERHDHLATLLQRLEMQTFKDFEVVIVDQSTKPWATSKESWQLDLVYIHTDIKGAVNARNKAVFYGHGEIIAFIDDDCSPEPSWLENAANHFRNRDIVGIEGSITTDHRYDPNYRTVTNENFTGIGFMTANLFLKTSIFNKIGGFDRSFDHPHFREDTDLAWRALEYGEIPFCEDVEVYHPPHPRSAERESHSARVKFFEKDPLLLRKHPHRYRQLFLAEGHWQYTEGFWDNFIKGSRKYDIKVPGWCLRYFLKYAIQKILDPHEPQEST